MSVCIGGVGSRYIYSCIGFVEPPPPWGKGERVLNSLGFGGPKVSDTEQSADYLRTIWGILCVCRG